MRTFKAIKIGRTLARPILRVYLIIKFNKQFKKVNKSLELTQAQAIKYKNKGDTRMFFLNLLLYISIVQRDIVAMTIDALSHPDPWKKNLSMRSILLSIYETNISSVTGKGLKEALDDIEASKELKDITTKALRTMRKSQKKAQTQLRSLRNSSLAHRDPDAMYLYRSIRNINPDEFLLILNEFHDGYEPFQNALSLILIKFVEIENGHS